MNCLAQQIRRDCLAVPLLLYISLLLLGGGAHGQFWKLKDLSERDMFLLEAKSNMPSGMCYRIVEGKSKDPELRSQLYSFCCSGYRQLADTAAIKCEPVCTEDCHNGICTAPDLCECFPGYERRGGRCEEL